MDEWSGVTATWQEATHKSKYWIADTQDIVQQHEESHYTRIWIQ